MYTFPKNAVKGVLKPGTSESSTFTVSMRRLPSTDEPFFGVMVTLTLPGTEGSSSVASRASAMRLGQENSLGSRLSLSSEATSDTSCSPEVPSTRLSAIHTLVPARAKVVISFAIVGIVSVIAIFPGAFLSSSRNKRRNWPMPMEATPVAAASK